MKVEYKIPLVGSKLFDFTTMATAKKLCETYAHLEMICKGDGFITLYGDLSEADAAALAEDMAPGDMEDFN